MRIRSLSRFISLGFVALSLHLGACSSISACGSDQDCKGDRVCNDGACTAPLPTTSGTSGGAGSGDGTGGTGGGSCTPKVYYHDADQDTYGGTETQMACIPPGPYWVLVGGDCNDASPLVHPNQAAFFPQPYDRGGIPSFDYDCDGAETKDPSDKIAGSSCYYNGTDGTCPKDQAGYLQATPLRSGPGVDAYCGSTSIADCYKDFYNGQWNCASPKSVTSSPLPCR
jgi:hypothetical protein